MKHLLNTLFVTSEDIYLSLDGENVVANRNRQEIARYPLHTLAGIISFSYPDPLTCEGEGNRITRKGSHQKTAPLHAENLRI